VRLPQLPPAPRRPPTVEVPEGGRRGAGAVPACRHALELKRRAGRDRRQERQLASSIRKSFAPALPWQRRGSPLLPHSPACHPVDMHQRLAVLYLLTATPSENVLVQRWGRWARGEGSVNPERRDTSSIDSPSFVIARFALGQRDCSGSTRWRGSRHVQSVQPFSRKSHTPTVAIEFQMRHHDPQRPIWNTVGTVAVRDFWENGCTQ